MMVKLKLVDCLDTCGRANYEHLFNEINKRISKISRNEFNNLRYFLKRKSCKECVDQYEDLIFYRETLTRKLANDDCLNQFSIDQIVSQIKKLLK